MKLYIVRHGETDWNKQYLIQGQTDIPLNNNGITVASLTGKAYREEGLHFSVVYSSPLTRASKTAEILARFTTHPETPILYDDRLKEFDFGDLEGKTLLGVSPDKPDGSLLYTCFYQPEIYQPITGESYFQVIDRVKEFLESEIYSKEWKEEDNVLVVCHGGIIRAFLCAILNKPVRDFWDTRHKNLSTNIFSWNSKTRTLLPEAISKYYYN